MPAALDALEKGLLEVEALLRADPTPKGGLSPQPDVTRAVLRAALVLLSSHLERFIRASVAEAAATVSAWAIAASDLSLELRLQHSRVPFEQLIKQQWDKREIALSAFISSDAWLWSAAPQAPIDPDRLLTWMKSPKPQSLMKAYRLWGVDDIFRRITRAEATRGQLHQRLSELVSKRNDIAHGELGVDATRADIIGYKAAVRVFCRRADAVLAKTLRNRHPQT